MLKSQNTLYFKINVAETNLQYWNLDDGHFMICCIFTWRSRWGSKVISCPVLFWQSLHQQQEFDGARHYLMKALKISPNNTSIRDELTKLDE